MNDDTVLYNCLFLLLLLLLFNYFKPTVIKLIFCSVLEMVKIFLN